MLSHWATEPQKSVLCANQLSHRWAETKRPVHTKYRTIVDVEDGFDAKKKGFIVFISRLPGVVIQMICFLAFFYPFLAYEESKLNDLFSDSAKISFRLTFRCLLFA